MSGYENAPSTIMLATHCSVCGRPLRDAKSVELGIGPDCRKRYGFNIEVSEEARAEANKLVHQVAVHQGGITVLRAATRLRELGFEKLAATITERCAAIIITDEGSSISVKTPYDAAAAEAFRGVRMAFRGRWDGEAKVNRVPATPDAKRAVLRVLERFFAGQAAVGPKGPFTVAKKAA